ncbi:efflux transporter outer membrane subunit [Chryseobacterium sp.]|uniref:efflux transporter outer membrane subunit n=1 Tax=Chryseobacterium sp. TaxID=1871047 RepID=UPI0025BE351F|nr:efflux transporter outer membrane subunit [Chryseobacterium sp.]MBV8327769.1 efflux transporter outer membrane subunit [Chryseobacterium sp.]
MIHLKKQYRFFVQITAVSVVLFSCNVTQPYVNNQQVSDHLYGDATADSRDNIAVLSLKEIFKDPLLQDLIAEGIANNLDLKTAAANLKAAEANFVQSKQAFLPSLSGNASAGEYLLSNSQASASQIYQLYALSSWQVDVWGKLKSTKRSLYASYLASEAYQQAVQTQLVANIAATYYQLLAYDEQLNIVQQSLEVYSKDTETMKILKNSNVVTGAAVVQSAANYYAVKATVPDIKNNIRQTENTMSLLLGRTPGPVRRDSLFNEQMYNQLSIGLPAQLLANRPDVKQAELQLRSNFEQINIARTAFYPALTITGQAGLYATQLNSFFSAGAFFANIVGGLTQPIFNNGLNKQKLKVAQANYEAAEYNYSKVLLTAGQEVSNALYQYQMVDEKASSRKEQIANLEKAVYFTKELLKYTSATNYTDVLTSEQSLLTARQSAVTDKLQQLQAVVNLYAALGGGWK